MLESILGILAAIASALALWMRTRAKDAEVSVDLLLHENENNQREATTWKAIARFREQKIRDLEREKAEANPGSVFDDVFAPPKLPDSGDSN